MADAQFNVVSNLSIGDFIAEGGDTVENHAGGGKLKVYGRFQPWTDFFFGCELQTGAVLDLSRQSGVWNSTSRVKTSSVKPPRTVTFASGATITIDVGARTDAGDHGKIVSWTAAPANVTFRLADGIRGRLVVTSEGIFLRRGLMLIVR